MAAELTKRSRGRPATYVNAAERARAWRQRQRDLIAQAQLPAAPVVIEKIIEKIIEIPVGQNLSKIHRGKSSAAVPDANKLVDVLKSKFAGYGGVEQAKKLRVNVARAANTSREILAMFDARERIPETEKVFLEQACRFFEQLNAVFEVSQHSAKLAKTKADAENQAKHEARIAEAIRLTFGEKLDLAKVTTTAENLLAFASREVCAAEANRRGVDRAFFFITRDNELRRALKIADVARIAKEVAEVRLDVAESGRRWKDGEEVCYSGGWQDFMNYVRTKIA
jgi:hypothetical protein